MARITVEDSLKKVPSRFALVVASSTRAKDILKGASQLVNSENKAIVTALREIAAGKVGYREKTSAGKKKAAVA